MSTFRKKPVEIQAWEFSNSIEAPEWITAAVDSGVLKFHWKLIGTSYLTIKTLEGTMRGELGDWIIQGVKGELYPCKPEIFAATYEPVEEEQSC